MQVWITPVSSTTTDSAQESTVTVTTPVSNQEQTTTVEEVTGTIMVHLQNIADKTYDLSEFAGTRGQSRRLEGF
jgi:hypothetical protein